MTNERQKGSGRGRRDWIGLSILAAIILGLGYLTYTAVQQSRRAHELPNAVQRSDVAAVRTLLDQGFYTKQGAEEALQYCVIAGLGSTSFSNAPSQLQILRMLLDHGIGVKVSDPRIGSNPNAQHNISMLVVVAGRGNVEATRLFLDHGADPNEKSGEEPVLSLAILINQAEIVEMLLAHGADPNLPYGQPTRTPLGFALELGNRALVRTLLARGGDPNVSNITGRPLLVIAAEQGDAPLVSDLLNRGAKVNAKDRGAMTALIEAAWNGKTDIVRLLLGIGADVNADNGTVSVLWYAVDQSHVDIVKLLLAHGANPNGKVNILATAKERKNAQIIEMLKRAGAKG